MYAALTVLCSGLVCVRSTKVTHVISEGNQASELWTWLRAQTAPPVADTEVLDISWFTESMRAGGPVVVESRHRIQVRFILVDDDRKVGFRGCQLATGLMHLPN